MDEVNMTAAFTLSTELCDRLVALAGAQPAIEICGCIGADGEGICYVYPITNTAQDPKHRFVMAPKEFIDAVRTMREKGQILYAIYHSHPFAPPVPSTIDVREAGYPDTPYIIISVGYDPPVRAYWIRKNHVIPVEGACINRTQQLADPQPNVRVKTV